VCVCGCGGGVATAVETGIGELAGAIGGSHSGSGELPLPWGQGGEGGGAGPATTMAATKAEARWRQLKRDLWRRLGGFVAYWVGGACVLFKLEERWTMVDSLYFGVVTLSSVGFGDLILSTAASRVFGMLYALVGVFGTVAALGQVRTRAGTGAGEDNGIDHNKN
jgi:hypothetical protein